MYTGHQLLPKTWQGKVPGSNTTAKQNIIR